MTVKQLLKQLEKMNKDDKVRIKYRDWKAWNYYSFVKKVYDNRDWTVIITNDR